ncbi:hypothetical protein GW17_00023647 [Ensete ventricosum]|nr:hypothetical protein GW17_00023647 [Ensete ventricosum]
MPIIANTRRHLNRIASVGPPIETKHRRSDTNPRLFPAFPRPLIPLHVALCFYATPSFGPTRTSLHRDFVRGSESSAGAPQPSSPYIRHPLPLPSPSLVRGSPAVSLAPFSLSPSSDSPHRVSELASSTMVTVESSDVVFPSGTVDGVEQTGNVPIPPSRSFLATFRANLKETFFPDDPLRQFKNERGSRRFLMGLKYFFPVLEWLPSYDHTTLKSDLVAGITIASLAIPQGISYAKLANLPPILGLCKFELRAAAGIRHDGKLQGSCCWDCGCGVAADRIYAGKGGATVTEPNTIPSLSLLCNVLCWCISNFLGTLKSKKGPKFFWVSAAAPLTSVILGSLLVYFTHAENHGVQVVSSHNLLAATVRINPESSVITVQIGYLKKGLNPPSLTKLVVSPPHMAVALKTGIITAIIALAVRSRTKLKISMLMIFVPGPFSRSAVNYNAGCKTAMSNVVMAVAVAITLLFLTPLFHYTPLVVLSAIIVAAMLGLINYEAAMHLWHVDKIDFCVCMGAYLGVVFGSVEIGLVIAVRSLPCPPTLHSTSDLYKRTATAGGHLHTKGFAVRREAEDDCSRKHSQLLHLSADGPVLGGAECPRRAHSPSRRPNLLRQCKLPEREVSMQEAVRCDGLLFMVEFAHRCDSPFRISRWMDEEEEKLQSKGEIGIVYVILDLGANPGSEVMKKLDKSKALETIRQQWIFLTVAEAVAACNSFSVHACKSDLANHETDCDSVV